MKLTEQEELKRDKFAEEQWEEFLTQIKKGSSVKDLIPIIFIILYREIWELNFELEQRKTSTNDTPPQTSGWSNQGKGVV